MKQINRLKIRWDKDASLYSVTTPDKRRIEEFREMRNAVKFCESNLDFLTPIGKKRAESRIWNRPISAECDNCHKPLSRYMYKRDMGLCADCIRHIN